MEVEIALLKAVSAQIKRSEPINSLWGELNQIMGDGGGRRGQTTRKRPTELGLAQAPQR